MREPRGAVKEVKGDGVIDRRGLASNRSFRIESTILPSCVHNDIVGRKMSYVFS